MTKNFKKSEFECKCGCDMPSDVSERILELARELQIIRGLVRRPIKINSAYRCPNHNERAGGVSDSQHILGAAADIVIVGMSSEDTYDLLNKLQHSGVIMTGGLGLYNTFVHYDIRGRRKRWDNR